LNPSLLHQTFDPVVIQAKRPNIPRFVGASASPWDFVIDIKQVALGDGVADGALPFV